MKKIGIGFVVILGLALGLVIHINWGLAPIPEPGPVRSSSYDSEFSDAAAAADQVLTEARVALGAPSLSAAVGYKGSLLWAGAVGWQDIEGQVPATPKTRYRMGSSSKAITATVLARLLDQEILDLDSPISSYAPDLPDQWLALTPRQLMSHTAGMVGYSENRDLQGLYQTLRLQKHYSDLAETLETFDGNDLLFPPGSDFLYSSFDVNLMSVVMQRATSTPFLQLVAREVTGPLSLTDTYGDGPGRRDQYEARFYEIISDMAKPWRDVDLSVKTAAGGFVSRPSDMVILASAWLNESFITENTAQSMWTPQKLVDGRINDQNYAIGWRSDETTINDTTYKRVHHGGVSKGAMNWLVLYPELELAVDMSINTVLDPFSTFAAFEKDISGAFVQALSTK